MSKRISRSAFIKGVAGAALLGASAKIIWDWKNVAERIPCRMRGPSSRLGHLLRDGRISRTSPSAPAARKKVIIVGGGIAGLSAAWWLQKQGLSDFLLLEMESDVGGNSISGRNEISAFPWGAHYVPVANDESAYVRMLFEELGIIERYDRSGLPVYNELYLCHDLQERLFKDGSFQEGSCRERDYGQAITMKSPGFSGLCMITGKAAAGMENRLLRFRLISARKTPSCKSSTGFPWLTGLSIINSSRARCSGT